MLAWTQVVCIVVHGKWSMRLLDIKLVWWMKEVGSTEMNMVWRSNGTENDIPVESGKGKRDGRAAETCKWGSHCDQRWNHFVGMALVGRYLNSFSSWFMVFFKFGAVLKVWIFYFSFSFILPCIYDNLYNENMAPGASWCYNLQLRLYLIKNHISILNINHMGRHIFNLPST